MTKPVHAKLSTFQDKLASLKFLDPVCGNGNFLTSSVHMEWMPADLRKAHRENDKAVLDAYGFPHDISEPDLVARLMGLYQEME